MRAAALAFLAASTAAAAAQMPAVAPAAADAVALSGRISHPRSLTTADLASLAPVSVEVPASAKPGAGNTTYGGPLLWPLLDAAGWVDLPGRKTHLQHVVLARGRDGYVVALSIAELDPGFEGKQVIIATMQDGKKLAAPELVVPGDKRGGRRVHALAAVEVQ